MSMFTRSMVAFIFWTSSLFILPIHSQPRVLINQLLQQVDTMEVKHRAVAYCELAAHYQFIDSALDSVDYYASAALEIGQELASIPIQQMANYYLGMLAWRKDNDYNKALVHFKEVKRLVLEANNLEKLPTTNNAIATCEMMKGDLLAASNTLLEVIDQSLEYEDYLTLANASTNLGTIYDKLGLQEETIEINKKALSYLEQSDSPQNIYTKITIMLNLTTSYIANEQFEEAASQIETLDSLIKINDDPARNIRYYQVKMDYLDALGNEEALLKLADSTIAMMNELERPDPHTYTGAHGYRGIISALQGNREDAMEEVVLLEEIVDQVPLEQSVKIHKTLFTIHKYLGSSEKALFHLEQEKTIGDSLVNEETTNRILEYQTLYELEKKENEIQAGKNEALILRNRNTQLLLGIAGVMLIALLYYLFIQHKRRKEREKMYQIEQKMLALQMNPHFIFNAISSIQNYLFDENDRKAAIMHLSTFATLMRQILENNRERFIPLSEEIDFLTNYLNLQKLRFENKFDFEIEIDPTIDVDSTTIPPLLTQPFVENAIEHGKLYKVENGLLSIKIGTRNNLLHIEIKDNGVGLEESKLLAQNLSPSIKKKSLSLVITKERLDLLSKLLKRKFSFDVKAKERGTDVTINLPYLTSQ